MRSTAFLVVHRLIESIDLRALKGTIVAVLVVNVPAFLNYERTFDDRTDMNHIMPGKPKGNIAQVYAHRFMDRIVGRFKYLIDLHTASFGNINSLYVRADMTDPVTAEMAYLQRPQIILHNPPSDHTLRGAAMELGIPSITVGDWQPSDLPTQTNQSLCGRDSKSLVRNRDASSTTCFPSPFPHSV